MAIFEFFYKFSFIVLKFVLTALSLRMAAPTSDSGPRPRNTSSSSSSQALKIRKIDNDDEVNNQRNMPEELLKQLGQ